MRHRIKFNSLQKQDTVIIAYDNDGKHGKLVFLGEEEQDRDIGLIKNLTNLENPDNPEKHKKTNIKKCEEAPSPAK